MVKAGEINDQNPWWRTGQAFARYDRSLSKATPIFFERRQVPIEKGSIHILRGPRQVGKTTYLKDLVGKLMERGIPARDILYLSLDFFVSRRELRNAVSYFLDSRRDSDHIFLLLDEITSVEDWNLELKYLADRGILRTGSVLATGSNAVKLKEKGELLPGRGIEGNEYYVKPLSFREFVLQSAEFLSRHIPRDELSVTLENLKAVLSSHTLDLDSELDEIAGLMDKVLPFSHELAFLFRLYLITGGLPGVINHYFSNRYLKHEETILSSVSEIFVRDVLGDMNRLNKQETVTRLLLSGIVDRYGSRYSFSKLSRAIEKTHVTVIDYLQFMEDSFISFVLYAYDFNRKAIKAKGDKKIFFFDPFMFHSVKSYLTGREPWDVITGSLEDEDLLGNLVEGVVGSHLRMYGELPLMKECSTFLWYYYNKQGREIDAVMREPKGFVGIEVKYQRDTDERSVRRISPLKKSFLLSRTDYSRGEDCMVVPADIFLSLLPVSARNL
jgi:uncharacterized protein